MKDTEKSIQKAIQFIHQSIGPDHLWRDFSLEPGESDEWVSGYIGSVLCDTNDPLAVMLAEEAWNVLGWRYINGKHGWAYSGKAIVDADSTLWCLTLAELLGKGDHLIAESAKKILRQHLTSAGGISTYTANDISGIELTEEIIKMHQGWLQAHNCVTAAAAGLKWLENLTIPYLIDKQQEPGHWKGYWWYDDEYATGFATETIAHSQIDNRDRIIELASSWIASKLQSEGYISNTFFIDGSPFATALGLRVLLFSERSAPNTAMLRKGIGWLLRQQMTNGSWLSSAILRFPTSGILEPDQYTEWKFNIKHPWGELCLDQNGLFTTATVLKTLITYNNLFNTDDLGLKYLPV